VGCADKLVFHVDKQFIQFIVNQGQISTQQPCCLKYSGSQSLI
jgi:hypothetical protein